MPGFIIKNETQWPLTISLDQVGPLYYGLTKPSEEFVRSTGAVWFTISARVSLDEKCSIGPWDVAIPIITTTGGIVLAAVTGGASAFLSVTSSIGASALVSGGLISMSSIVVEGAVVGAAAVTPEAAAAILGKVFSEENATAKKRGCYAGWRGKRRYRVVGGPKSSYIDGKLHLDGQKMDIIEG